MTTALHDWAVAERAAIRAEEIVRAEQRLHVERGGPPPTKEMVGQAHQLRLRADTLFAAAAKLLPRSPDGESGT